MNIKKTFSLFTLGVKKHSPLILVCSGLVGFGVTTYLAVKAKPKVELIVEDVEAKQADGQEINNVEVGQRILKAVALPLATGVLSASAIVWSYSIQYRRIMVLSGVLASTQAAKSALEDSVKAKFGEAAYQEMLTTEEVTVTEVDGDGNEVKTKVNVRKELNSTIGEWFDQSSNYTRDDHGYNMAVIDDVAQTLDLKLFSKGYLLLNDVRKHFGFEPTKTGALVGWMSNGPLFDVEKIVYNEKREDGIHPEIFVKWTEPKYIYDQINYDTDFNVY